MEKKIKPLTEKFTSLEQSSPFISSLPSQIIHSDSIHLIGFCFDGTTSFRPGSRFGPNAIREVSMNLETYSPYLNCDLEDRSVVDLGNLPFYPSKPQFAYSYFKEITQKVNLEKDQVKFILLGGEHSVSYGPIELYLKQYPNLVLLHLDAHADLRDGYLEEKYSHASIIRRVMDHFGPGHQLIQYGIRSGTKDEFEWMRGKGTLRTSLQDLVQSLNELPEDRPIYLTLDLDFFDPAYFPGTGTPEAGGEDFHSFVKIMKILIKKNFVGADVTELAPMLDATGNSSCFASKVVREIILGLT